ncbi:hypothetical protein T484DRAFT_1613330 [Baffinella frigidus]|nr:hypothetical protein T484DRAFT_1613330 [Cryptophyta sp. CCMP2293]
MHPEPANALSLPTWMVHVSSLIEWLAAMGLIWRYAETTGNPRWKGLTIAMIPFHSSGLCACTYHLFYNAPPVGGLVLLQAVLTLVGDLTCWAAAYRIFTYARDASTLGIHHPARATCQRFHLSARGTRHVEQYPFVSPAILLERYCVKQLLLFLLGAWVTPPVPTRCLPPKLATRSAAGSADSVNGAEHACGFSELRLGPTPENPKPTTSTLHPTPYTLHPTPYTLHPKP